MSPLVRSIPVGLIANTAAKGMGMSGGIPGLRSSMTMGEAADNVNQMKTIANTALPYAQAAAGLAGSRVRGKAQEARGGLRDRVDGRLQRAFLRENPDAKDDEDGPGAAAGKRDDSIYRDLKEKGNERILRILRRREKAVKDQIRKEVAKKAVRVASRISLRLVNTALGASVIGLVVVWVVWTIQLIAGNLLGSQTIPPLKSWEKVAWFLLGALLGAAVLGIIILLYMIIHPEQVVMQVVIEAIEAVSNWLKELFTT